MRMAEAMVARGGRSVPMISGFLGDRPVKTPADWGFEASRGGQAGASPPHRSLRSGFAPSSGKRELVSARRAEAMGAVSGRSVPLVRGFLGDRPAERPADWGFEASSDGQAGASPPQRSLRFGSLSSGKRGVRFRDAGGGDGAGSGRSMPVVRGFLGDRPAESAPIRGLKLRWAARPAPHHLTARSAPVALSSGKRGACFREAGGGDGGGERAVGAHGSSFSGGQTC